MTEIVNQDIPVYPVEDRHDPFKRRRIVVGAAMGLLAGLGMAKGFGYIDDHYIDLNAQDRQCAESLLRGSDQEVADDCFDTGVEDLMDRTWAYEDGELKLIYHLDRAEMANKQTAYVKSMDKVARSMRRGAQAVLIVGGAVFGALDVHARGRRRDEERYTVEHGN